MKSYDAGLSRPAKVWQRSINLCFTVQSSGPVCNLVISIHAGIFQLCPFSVLQTAVSTIVHIALAVPQPVCSVIPDTILNTSLKLAYTPVIVSLQSTFN